ncbi:MAG: DUF2891 domain-containing protein [Planctomycetes bacterium]|nr:DUF2891 domain-containing protein [Planctomycetota bacterium]
MTTNPDPQSPQTTDDSTIASLVQVSLDALHREYPNYVQHLMLSDADACTPRIMKPAFFGCFDWHSAVHNHWALLRVLRLFPQIAQRDRILSALHQSFTAENIKGELDYISSEARSRFEMPYGAAWLLLLCAELREAGDSLHESASWLSVLHPLETLFAERFFEWLEILPAPIRSGEHSQSAFAMGLADDWAVISGRPDMRELIASKARQFYLTDLPWPFRLEPSAYDFLSPGLAEADLLRRVLAADVYHHWLSEFLPIGDILAGDTWLEPVASVNPSDGKLAHWSGLNLSRAWMLSAVASECGETQLGQKLSGLAIRHQMTGLEAIEAEEYAGAHWLVSFAIYLLTARWNVSPPSANRV